MEKTQLYLDNMDKRELYDKAKEAYYNGESIMTDAEFDQLEAEIGLVNQGYIGTLFIEDGKIKLETRYKRIDIIESLSDIVDVAYEWDYGYCNKNSIYTVYSVGEEWMNLYKDFGKDTTIFR